MTPPRPPTERLEKLFRRRKCWMLDQLAQTLGYALISVRRFLKQIGYFRSYTDNGKWYTLHDSPLSQLHKAGRLDRLRLCGQFRYLAANPRLNGRQREQAALAQTPSPTATLSTQTALWVLVEHIKEPTLSFEQMAARLQAHRHLAVAPETIQRFFQEHDLKKTPLAPN